jgi:genetic interactor of prohibitins 3, mitochondrial
MRAGLANIGRLTRPELLWLRATIPEFLCPALFHTGTRIPSLHDPSKRARRRLPSCRQLHSATPPVASSMSDRIPPPGRPKQRSLPELCPGCGAPTQAVAPEEAGYYSESRKAVKTYLNHELERKTSPEDDFFNAAIQNADDGAVKGMGLDPKKKGLYVRVSATDPS